MKEKQDILNDIWVYLSNNKFLLNRSKMLYARILKWSNEITFNILPNITLRYEVDTFGYLHGYCNQEEFKLSDNYDIGFHIGYENFDFYNNIVFDGEYLILSNYRNIISGLNHYHCNLGSILYLPTIFNITKCDLGTIGHIDRVNKAELTYGPYFALTQLMSEFNSYDNKTIEDLKYNQYTNFDRVCKKVNELVKKVKMTEEIHYFRNRINKGPEALELLLQEKDDWVLLSPGKSAFHMHGRDGIFNLKFISKNEGNFEVVYDKDNKLVTDRINMGTYNFANPEDIKEHEKYDLKPYYSWGNTEMSIGDGQLESLKKAINNLTRFSSDLNAKQRYEKYYFEMYGNPSDVADSIKLLENDLLMAET